MGCKKIYYGNDGQPSELYQQLVGRFGEVAGESMYLQTYRMDSKSLSLNQQGEPKMEELLSAKNISFRKMSPEEIQDTINSSNKQINPIREGGRHAYSVNGTELLAVSDIVNKYVEYTGLRTEIRYDEEGTRLHGILEDVVNGLDNESIRKRRNITGWEENMMNEFRHLVKRLRAVKGSVLIPEVRVALTESGVAGTVDLLHIKPNGKVDVYDLKTAFQTPGRGTSKPPWDPYETSSGIKHYKANRYTLQTTIYKYLLEHSDNITGRPAIDVDNVYIVPVSVYANPDNYSEFVSATVGSPENINSYQSGNVNYAELAEKRARDYFETQEKIRKEIRGHDTTSSVDSFIDFLAPKTGYTPEQTEKFAKQILAANHKKKNFYFNGAYHTWVGDSRDARMAQVREVLATGYAKADRDLVSAAISTLEGTPKGIFLNNETAAARLRQLYSLSDADKVFRLSNIEGFEGYDDVLIFQKKSGTIDLIKLTFEDITRTFDVKNKNVAHIGEKLAGIDGSIVGNYLSFSQANSRGIKLQNTIADREKLRLTLLAMELKKANPDLKTDRIMVNSFTSRLITVPEPVRLEELLPQVNAIYESKEIRSSISGTLKDTMSDKSLYSEDVYQPDYAIEYLNYLIENFSNRDFYDADTKRLNSRGWTKKILEKYSNDELTKDELVDNLIRSEKGLKNLIASKYTGSLEEVEKRALSDPEYMKLAQTVLTINGLKLYPEGDVTEQYMGHFMSYVYSPTKTGRQTLDAAFDAARRHIDKVKRDLDTFNREKTAVIKRLMDDNPFWKKGISVMGKTASIDTFAGMGQSVFRDLIQHRTDANGKPYPTIWLVEEGSPEFRKLSHTQQDTIRWLNDKVQEWFRKSHPQTDENGEFLYHWPRGMIPVMAASPNTELYKFKEGMVKGQVKKAGRAAKNYAKRVWDITSKYDDFRPPDKTNEKTKIYDYFIRQIDQSTGGPSQSALARAGLDEDMNLVDSKMNETLETDLETIITEFVHQSSKKTHLDEALPIMRMFRSIFSYYDMAYSMSQPRTVKLIDNYINDNFFSEKVASDVKIDASVQFLVGLSTKLLLGYNWKVFTANGMQMSFSSLAHAMTATMSGDKRLPGLKENTKAGNEMLKMADPIHGADQARKLALLMSMYMPEDIWTLRGKKYKSSQRGLIDDDTAFVMDRMIEHGHRTHYLVAQMIKDGTYDAHQLKSKLDKNGNRVWFIEYNPALDQRFKKEPKLKEAIMRGLKDDGIGITEDGQMTMAYDWRLRQRYKSYADEIFASMDKDLKSDYAHNGIFTAFSMFRSWFRDSFLRVVKREVPNAVTGDYVKRDGEFVWTKSPYKGILWTMLDAPALIYNKIKNGDDISDVDKQNMLLFVNTVGMWSLLAMLINTALSDKDDPKVVAARSLFIRGIQDLNNYATLGPMLGIVSDPFIFVSYYTRVFNNTIRAIKYAGDGEIDMSMKKLMGEVPIAREFI